MSAKRRLFRNMEKNVLSGLGIKKTASGHYWKACNKYLYKREDGKYIAVNRGIDGWEVGDDVGPLASGGPSLAACDLTVMRYEQNQCFVCGKPATTTCCDTDKCRNLRCQSCKVNEP